jgi:hypothetical protein
LKVAEDIAIMIDTPLSQAGFGIADRKQETLQEYVSALLARQQALDLLETVHQQINQAWATLRKLLGDAVLSGGAARTCQVTRTSLVAQARNSYRFLEKRREEYIAVLHQAECRANAALQGILAARAEAANRRPDRTARGICRRGGRKEKQLLSKGC